MAFDRAMTQNCWTHRLFTRFFSIRRRRAGQYVFKVTIHHALTLQRDRRVFFVVGRVFVQHDVEKMQWCRAERCDTVLPRSRRLSGRRACPCKIEDAVRFGCMYGAEREALVARTLFMVASLVV